MFISVNLFQQQNSYDSVSSYDSYNQRSLSNILDDLKTYNDRERIPNRDRAVHDPYRFTRSTQQPIKHSNSDVHAKPSKASDYPLYRYTHPQSVFVCNEIQLKLTHNPKNFPFPFSFYH